MRATAFEFRFRVPLLAVVLALGFWSPGFRSSTVWILGSGAVAHQRWTDIQTASLAVGEAAAVLALLAATLRTWAFAVQAKQSMAAVAAQLHCLALAVFMPLYGAIFAVALTALLTTRILIAEQSMGRIARIGRLTTRRWGHALLAEVYFWLACVGMFVCVPRFNATLVLQAVLASAGTALIVQGFFPPLRKGFLTA